MLLFLVASSTVYVTVEMKWWCILLNWIHSLYILPMKLALSVAFSLWCMQTISRLLTFTGLIFPHICSHSHTPTDHSLSAVLAPYVQWLKCQRRSQSLTLPLFNCWRSSCRCAVVSTLTLSLITVCTPLVVPAHMNKVCCNTTGLCCMHWACQIEYSLKMFSCMSFIKHSFQKSSMGLRYIWKYSLYACSLL